MLAVQTTHNMDLLKDLLNKKEVITLNWTVNGAEATIEAYGEVYKVYIEREENGI